jgi:hypothetical protein
MNPSANATYASQIVLAGGTLGTTGITNGRTFTSSSTLKLNDVSTITLDAGVNHSIRVAPSNGVDWSAAPSTQALTVFGWQGTAGQSGTAGKIFVGTTTGTLTAAQLAQIHLTDFRVCPIILIGTGEIVPQPSTPLLTITGVTDHGSSCLNTAATTLTYTITNSGNAQADGVTVTSDNPEFVVSNLSATSIAANGGTVTYQVTFTPGAAGSRKCNDYGCQHNFRK